MYQQENSLLLGNLTFSKRTVWNSKKRPIFAARLKKPNSKEFKNTTI
jgi:hypothetical protein